MFQNIYACDKYFSRINFIQMFFLKLAAGVTARPGRCN